MDVPRLTGFNFEGGLSVSPEFAALLLGLVLYTSAFVAEVVRAGIQAISRGQTEAKKAALWARAYKLREGLGVPASARLAIFEKRDVHALAEIAAKGFQTDRKADWARDAKEARRKE